LKKAEKADEKKPESAEEKPEAEEKPADTQTESPSARLRPHYWRLAGLLTGYFPS
jgi:hypothetical protein